MIPTFEELMRPMLRLAAERHELSMAEVREALAGEFGLTEDELRQQIPSGYTTTWISRVHWAKTYLFKAGAIDSPRRGMIRANALTSLLLERNPERIDKSVLTEIPAFKAWVSKTKGSESTPVVVVPDAAASDALTPRESLEVAFATLRREVAEELLTRVKAMTPEQFEYLVLRLMRALGYGGVNSAEHLGGSGDGGVDGVIREDRLGFDLIYVQAKRWENQVSRPTVQTFAGSLEGFRARKGVLITTSGFSRDAREYVKQIEKRIVLIYGIELADYVYDLDLGVSAEQSYQLKAVDSDFFDTEFD